MRLGLALFSCGMSPACHECRTTYEYRPGVESPWSAQPVQMRSAAVVGGPCAVGSAARVLRPAEQRQRECEGGKEGAASAAGQAGHSLKTRRSFCLRIDAQPHGRNTRCSEAEISQRVVERDRLADHSLPAELAADPLAARFAEPGRALGIGEDPLHRSRRRRGIPRLEQEAGLAVHDLLRDSADPRRDDRHACGHRLEHRVRQPLVVARQQEARRFGEQPRHVRVSGQQPHVAVQPELADERGRLRLERAVRGQVELCLREPLTDARECANCEVGSLLGGEPPDDDDAPRHDTSRPVELVRVDPVVDHPVLGLLADTQPRARHGVLRPKRRRSRHTNERHAARARARRGNAGREPRTTRHAA